MTRRKKQPPFIIARDEMRRGLFVALHIPYGAFEFEHARAEALERLHDELRDLLDAAADPSEAEAALLEAGR